MSRPKPSVASIFNPKDGTWKTYTLKHWFGKRVKYRGRYGRIIAQQLDHNDNFHRWIVRIPRKDMDAFINDPNMPCHAVDNCQDSGIFKLLI